MLNRIWQFAEFQFHESSLELRREDVVVPAEAKAREVLRYLLSNAEQPVVSQAEIKEAVWGRTHVSDSSVNVAVNKIRDAFGDEHRERILRTLRGSGYSWSVQVVDITAPRAEQHPELGVGDPVPGRPGWLLTQKIFADEHCATWLSREAVGEARHVVQLAWTETGLHLLRAKADLYAALHMQPEAGRFFSPVCKQQFEVVPYALETEYLGPSLPAWAAAQQGLRSVSESLRVGIVAAAANALHLLHRAERLHGALSAECVHVLQQGDTYLVRMDGFGGFGAELEAGFAARLPGAPKLQPECFEAPELKSSETATRKGDMYALGVLLYQCAACTLAEAPMLGWEQRVSDPVLRKDIAETAHMDPAFRTRNPGELAGDLQALAMRRLHEEELAQSREAQQLAEKRLTLELAKKPLRRALALALALVSLTIAVTAVLAIHSLQRERKEARAGKSDQEALQTFFQRLYFDGDVPLHGPVTADALTERGLQMSRALEGAPGIHSAVLNTLGVGFTVLGRFPKAQQALDTALTERKKVYGWNSPETAETLRQLAALKLEENDARAALALAREALAMEQKALPADDMALARTRTEMAEVLTGLGDYAGAAALLRQSIAREQGHPELLDDLSTALNDLSVDEDYLGNLETAIGLQKQSLAIDRAMLGDRHPDIAEHLLTLSDAHRLLGEPEQAAAEARQALSILAEWFQPGHHEIAAAEAVLGLALLHLPGKAAEAESQLRSALAALRREGAPSRAEANALIGLGAVDRLQHRLPQAVASDREALHIYQQLFPKPTSTWIVPLCSLAELYVEEGAWEPARSAGEQAMEIAQSTLKADDGPRLRAALLLAKLCAHQGKPLEAKALLDDVLARAPEGEPRTREVRQDALKQVHDLLGGRVPQQG